MPASTSSYTTKVNGADGNLGHCRADQQFCFYCLLWRACLFWQPKSVPLRELLPYPTTVKFHVDWRWLRVYVVLAMCEIAPRCVQVGCCCPVSMAIIRGAA